jgi:hypothetical protein
MDVDEVMIIFKSTSFAMLEESCELVWTCKREPHHEYRQQSESG